ncbi:DUF1697 domain-containing protein [Streptomyces sp. GMY02]|uniref:DUF1697 domain-containing protein n=1 Tax=Streptomyces sp. GMY02 TaxID=1333528 RepID=UPI001C2C60DA|nr:DUF1697 domain-containing protein [Streptomyces sp. GMY02]QXE34133.1 DUF1697 domain-containing protein [Streptomyces sp. GMY02]
MTTTYAALLRGINVSGHKRVPMAELRDVLAGLGHRDVRTYLQSGNAVFTADTDSTGASGPGGSGGSAGSGGAADESALAAGLERAVEERFGFRVDCLVRGAAYLRAVAEECPFPAATLEGRQLHATYFSEPVDPERLASLDPAVYLPEEFRLGDRVLYLYAPNGVGRSKLAEALARPALFKGITATSRNWNTVLKLVELTRG